MQDHVPSLRGVLGIAQGVVGRGSLHDTGQGGRFDQVQICCRFGEVATSSCFNSVRPGPEVGDVQVASQNLALAEALFQGESQACLADLAGEAVAACLLEVFGGCCLIDENVFDVLHGQGRRPLLNAPRSCVARKGANDTPGIDAVVLEETHIFDSDDRLTHDRGDAVQRHLDAVLVIQRREERAV